MWMTWGSIISSASLFFTDSLNFLLFSSSSTMSVECTILRAGGVGWVGDEEAVGVKGSGRAGGRLGQYAP